MRVKFASAIGSGACFIAGIALPIAFPHIDASIGKALLLLALVLFSLAVGLYWPNRKVEGVQGTVQTTHGAGSPAIGVVHGDYINNAPAALQERKSPYGFSRPPTATEYAREEMNRLMRGTEGYPLGFARSRADQKPNLPLNELLSRVYKKLGPVPQDTAARVKFRRKVDLEIIDQVVENGLRVWGRYGDRAREEISASSLKQGNLDHRKGTFAVWGDGSRPMLFADLRFDREEVDLLWPK